jgi:acetyltransferase
MVRIDGYELDPREQHGSPVWAGDLLFCPGGQLVEVYRDHAVALPSLNRTLAQRLTEQTHIFEALKGVRGRQPIDLVALENLLVCFGRLAVEQPWIAEIDLNPRLASSDGLLALDGRG